MNVTAEYMLLISSEIPAMRGRKLVLVEGEPSARRRGKHPAPSDVDFYQRIFPDLDGKVYFRASDGKQVFCRWLSEIVELDMVPNPGGIIDCDPDGVPTTCRQLSADNLFILQCYGWEHFLLAVPEAHEIIGQTHKKRPAFLSSAGDFRKYLEDETGKAFMSKEFRKSVKPRDVFGKCFQRLSPKNVLAAKYLLMDALAAHLPCELQQLKAWLQ